MINEDGSPYSFLNNTFTERERQYIEAYEEWSEDHEGWTQEAHELGQQHDDFDAEKMHYETAMRDIVCAVTSIFFYHVHNEGWNEFEDNEQQIKTLTNIVYEDICEHVLSDLKSMEQMHEDARVARIKMRQERVAKGLPPDYTPEEIEAIRKEAQARFKKFEAERREQERMERKRVAAMRDHFPTPGCDCQACRAKREGLGDNVAH